MSSILSKQEMTIAYENAFSFLDEHHIDVISPEELKQEYFEQIKAKSFLAIQEMQLNGSNTNESSGSLTPHTLFNFEETPKMNLEGFPDRNLEKYSPDHTQCSTMSSFSTNRSCLLKRRDFTLKKLATIDYAIIKAKRNKKEEEPVNEKARCLSFKTMVELKKAI